MTIHALLKYQGLFEISSGVALHTLDFRMSAEKRIFGFGVVKILIERRGRDSLPSGRAVAGLARLFEAAAVRISMAIRTAAECNSPVARLSVRPRSVALLAFHASMQTRKRIAGLRMVELADTNRFPVVEVVAL